MYMKQPTDDDDYFVHEPAVTDHAVWSTGNIWAAAVMFAYEIPFVGYGPTPHNPRGEWQFDNANDAAYKLAYEFRTDQVVLPVMTMQKSYRRAAREAAQVRGENERYHGTYSR